MKPSRAMEPGGEKDTYEFLYTLVSVEDCVPFIPPPFFPVINIEYIFDQYIINSD